MKFGYAEYVLIFKSLADETRLKILHMLSKTQLCACDILEEVNISQSTLSYHMKLLTDCGLVNSEKSGLWMHYSLNKDRALQLETLMKEIAESSPLPIQDKKKEKC